MLGPMFQPNTPAPEPGRAVGVGGVQLEVNDLSRHG
jgi:hypothetical protein